MSTLKHEAFVFDPRPHYPLLITAKRYWKEDSRYLEDDDALTLVFAHGTGFHKEQWEPAIDDLYSLLGDSGSERVRIREVWSIDAPNHGDAAVLNEKTLLFGYEPVFGWEEYARSIHAFLAGLGIGVNTDFTKRKLVGIGHSMGAVSVLLSQNYFPLVKFTSVILCELMTMQQKYIAKPQVILVKGSSNRRDIWPSTEEAYKSFKSRGAWKIWDDRVLRTFVEYGTRPLPTAYYPDKTEGVTLKCSRAQETASYRDPLGFSRVYNNLREYAKRTPVHMIYGAINDYLPEESQEDVVNAIGGKHCLASFSRVEGAGHLIVQMNPRGLAKHIYNALVITQNSPLRGKL
ncbi:alpha/beta-hydrolase [Pluteus cervinus]|uniref:Alpha/beta-hydrolase n=1 Tax=Pluteus cervinus TaxID=181527 RepID=A0ACD3APQ1_9AGAR|nr:alpha/beta-hydrolase [Pluteus cervinus]